MRLSRMEPKQLEKALLEMDFASRHEEKLKSFMDTELIRRMKNHLNGSQNSHGLALAIYEAHSYFSKVLLIFNPLFYGQQLEKVEEIRETSKQKRRLEFKEKILMEFKSTFLNHLKYCTLDNIEYEALFSSFIK